MIHSTVIIDPSAIIADDVSIGPYAIIGADVEIGKGCQIESHVVIKGPTKIGQNNHIHQFSSVGEDPQDKKYSGEPTLLDIGDNNLIREGVTINRGTVQGGGTTKIGDNNWIMACVHTASSVGVSPRQTIAIASAAACSSAIAEPVAYSSMNHSIWSAVKTRPSRLARMMSTTSTPSSNNATAELRQGRSALSALHLSCPGHEQLFADQTAGKEMRGIGDRGR